jgi:hypothetical protein
MRDIRHIGKASNLVRYVISARNSEFQLADVSFTSTREREELRDFERSHSGIWNCCITIDLP